MSAAPEQVPEFRELVTAEVVALLGDYTDDELPQVMWYAALGSIEKAIERTRGWAWWRARPDAELRRLRREVDSALRLAAIAVDFQEVRNKAVGEENRLVRDLQRQAGEARRRAQTLPAERARLAKARARRENPAARPAPKPGG